jgi:hypothetical protein
MAETTGLVRGTRIGRGLTSNARIIPKPTEEWNVKTGHHARRPKATAHIQQPKGLVPIPEADCFRMTGRPLRTRLALADQFAAANPGRSISPLLLDLFPELWAIETERSIAR